MSESLSKREIEVLRLVADGLTAQEIADRLCISPHTSKLHIFRIREKTECHKIALLVRWAIREGLVIA